MMFHGKGEIAFSAFFQTNKRVLLKLVAAYQTGILKKLNEQYGPQKLAANYAPSIWEVSKKKKKIELSVARQLQAICQLEISDIFEIKQFILTLSELNNTHSHALKNILSSTDRELQEIDFKYNRAIQIEHEYADCYVKMLLHIKAMQEESLYRNNPKYASKEIWS